MALYLASLNARICMNSGKTLPAACGRFVGDMVRNPVLAYRFYDHPGLFESAAVTLQRPVLAVKGHFKPSSLEPIAVPIFVQI